MQSQESTRQFKPACVNVKKNWKVRLYTSDSLLVVSKYKELPVDERVDEMCVDDLD